MSSRAFVVDDERMARGNLVHALSQHDRWEAVRCLANGRQLRCHVEADRPDVVFLDVQMPGDDGLTLGRQLLSLRPAPLIVFVTAYSEYAVAAFELYAVDYLLKPFDDQRFARCVQRLERLLEDRAEHERALVAQSAWAESAPLNRIVIRSSTSVRVIDVDDIHWLGANGNYVDIHHADGSHLLRASLKQVLASLPEGRFVRVHRGFAVRVDLIREVSSKDGERSAVHLASGRTLPVGKSFRNDVLEVICGR